MGEIHKFTRGDVTLFPATITDAVVHPQMRATVSEMITEFNVSKLFPTSGSNNSSSYTLQSAISLLYNKLEVQHQVPGIKIIFIDVEKNEPQEWRYLGRAFTNPQNWAREDSWYVEMNEEVGDIDTNFFDDALRKSEQLLTQGEKDQVKSNLGIELDVKKINWSNSQNLNQYKTPGVFIITGYKYLYDNIPIKYVDSNVKIFATLTVYKIPNTEQVGQNIVILDSNSGNIKTYSRTYNNTNEWGIWSSLKSEIDLGTGIDANDLSKLTESTTYVGEFLNYNTLVGLCDGLSNKALEILREQNSFPFKLENKIIDNKSCSQVLTVYISDIIDRNKDQITSIAKEIILIRTGEWINSVSCSEGHYTEGYYLFDKFTSLINNGTIPQIVNQSQSGWIIEIYPYKFYTWNNNPTRLNIKLAGVYDTSTISKYDFQFSCGDIATSLSVEDNVGKDVKWVGGVNPVISPNKTYQVSIINGCATITEFDNEKLPITTTTTTTTTSDEPEITC